MTQIVRRVAMLAVALGIVWSSPIAVGTARADNLGGKFERCARLVEFVAPTTGDSGHLTLVGIGPGLYNEISDTTHHRFPFSPDLVMSDSLKSQLQVLAKGRRFTCLRMEGDGMGVITQLAVHTGTRHCGSVSRNDDGVYAIDEEGDFLHVELIADAAAIVEADTVLRRFLGTEQRSVPCLVFDLMTSGVVRSIRLDGTFSWCGALTRNGSELRVGSIALADANSSSAELLSSRTARAGYLLARRDTRACGTVELRSSRLVDAWLTAEGSICGPVTDVAGKTSIDRIAIPNILGDTQTTDLRADIGGTACLSLAIEENRVKTALRTTPPPAPTPSPNPGPTASPSQTPTASTVSTPDPSPSVAASPSPSDAPVVPAVISGTRTSSTSLPSGALILGLVAIVAVVVVSLLGLRRYRASLAGARPTAADVAAAVSEPDAGAVVTQPSVVRLTRREQEVLAMLYEGLSNKEIGSHLFISESTAGVHVSNIMAKLGARSRTEAATLAHRMRLTTQDTFEH